MLPNLLTGCGLVGKGERRVYGCITLLTIKSHVTHFTYFLPCVWMHYFTCNQISGYSFYLLPVFDLTRVPDMMWARPNGCALYVWLHYFICNQISYYSFYSLLMGCGPVRTGVRCMYGCLPLFSIKSHITHFTHC